MIRKVESRDQEAVLRLLRTDFYPYEPCAVGLDLCPLGYRWSDVHEQEQNLWEEISLTFALARIPALEAALVKIMDEGRSYVAFDQEAPEVTIFVTWYQDHIRSTDCLGQTEALFEHDINQSDAFSKISWKFIHICSPLATQESTESIVGVVLCSLMRRNDSSDNPNEEEFDLPEKFRKLEKFFDDLKTDYGERCIFDDLATEAVLDIFILATRWVVS